MEEVQAGDGARLAVSGELDLATADKFAARLRALSATGSTVLLDLSGVEFMDSSGLTALVATIAEAREADRHIEVAPELGRQVTRLLEITGTASFLAAA